MLENKYSMKDGTPKSIPETIIYNCNKETKGIFVNWFSSSEKDKSEKEQIWKRKYEKGRFRKGKSVKGQF